MLVQFGNNWIQKIPLTAKLDLAYGLVQFWPSSEFFSSNYFHIGEHVVLSRILNCCRLICNVSVYLLSKLIQDKFTLISNNTGLLNRTGHQKLVPMVT